MNFRTFVALLRRGLGLIVLCSVLGAAAAALVTSRMPDLYASRTRVIASSAQAELGAAYTGTLLAIERARGYVVLVESRVLAQRVHDDLGLDVDLSELIDSVQASVVDETAVLELSVVDDSPVEAQRIAQTYSEELVKLARDIETPDNGTAPVKLTIIDDATISNDPVSPRPILNLVLGALVGLLAGLTIALLRELLNTRISSVEDLQGATSAAVLGTVGRAPGRRNRLITDLAAHDSRVEAFRALRTNLQYVDIDTPHRAFVITSALPGEGKTSTAVNLALTMARADLRVLLVDGDLRRPCVAGVLEMDETTGLTSVLLGRVTFAEAVQVHPGTGLDVLTSGPIPPNATELFQTKAMGSLVRALRADYDFVLFDSAPLLPVADTAVLGVHTDGALVVVRHKKTKLEQLVTGLTRLERTGVITVGVILNHVTVKGRNQTYGSYYGRPVPRRSLGRLGLTKRAARRPSSARRADTQQPG